MKKMSINKCMNFDCIIACGDSFTEGTRSVLNISVGETWPGLLARKFNIPFINLAHGGASNYDIALQPMTSDYESLVGARYKKPLFIFGFTIHHRLTYFNYFTGQLESFFTVLPEYISDSDNLHVRSIEPVAISGLRERRHQLNESRFYSKMEGQKLDSFLYATHAAIEIAHNVKIINPEAEILWGFIHSNTPFNEYDFYAEDQKHLWYKHKDTNFNEYLPGRKSLQYLSDEKELWVSPTDCHPNQRGMQLYADALESIIIQKYDK